MLGFPLHVSPQQNNQFNQTSQHSPGKEASYVLLVCLQTTSSEARSLKPSAASPANIFQLLIGSMHSSGKHDKPGT